MHKLMMIFTVRPAFSGRLLSQGFVSVFQRGMSILGHGRVFTGGDSPLLLEDSAVYYENDTIIDVGETAALRKKYPRARFFDAGGKLIMPGFICTHAHFYGMFARGMALKDEPPKNFKEILERLWWRLDKALEPEDNYLSAMVFLSQAIRAGTTTVVDHHASPNCIAGSLDTIANATKEAGIRASLCYEVTDRNGIKGADEGIAENVRFIRKCLKDNDPMLSALFGIHAAFTVSDETLDSCAKALKGIDGAQGKVGFHLHIAEDGTDAEDSVRRCGKRTMHRLKDAGILIPETLAAHCVKIDDSELEVIKESGISVIHNPESNMNNAVGVADVLRMMKEGVRVGLGTDGMTLDMIQESKVNYLLHKLNKGDPRVMGPETYDMLFKNNAKIASKMFPKEVGELKKGGFADIIVVDYNPPTPLHTGNFPWHIQFGMSSCMVDTTIIGGKVVMANKNVLTFSEADIMRRARERAPGVWERF